MPVCAARAADTLYVFGHEGNVIRSYPCDCHPYRDVPCSEETLDELSGRSSDSDQKLCVTEGGLCPPINVPSILSEYHAVIERSKQMSNHCEELRSPIQGW